jgi:hypothetical protein
MFTNSQVIIVLLAILIILQLYQLFNTKENFVTGYDSSDKYEYKTVNYNTPMMRCDGNSGMVNTKCMVKSNIPKVKKICDSKLNLTDGPNYDTPEGHAVQQDIQGNIKLPQKIINKVDDDDNSLLKLLNESEMDDENMNDAKSVGNLEK